MRLLVGGLLAAPRPAPVPPGAGQRHRDRPRPAARRLGRRAGGPAARHRGGAARASTTTRTTTRMEGDVTLPAGSAVRGPAGAVSRLARIGRPGAGPIAVINGRCTCCRARTSRRHPGGGRPARSEVPGPRTGPASACCWDARRRSMRSPGDRWCCGSGGGARRAWRGHAPRFRPARSGRTLCSRRRYYNRIEGLPIVFGPTFELRPVRAHRAQLDLRGILRTAGEGPRLSSDFGYDLAERRFRSPAASRGGCTARSRRSRTTHCRRARSAGRPFLLQRDYRDYFARHGGARRARPSDRSRASRCHCRRGPGTVRSSPPTVVAVPQQRTWRPTAERRRPLFHDPRPARPRHPERV